jgi:hypothetical protein
LISPSAVSSRSKLFGSRFQALAWHPGRGLLFSPNTRAPSMPSDAFSSALRPKSFTPSMIYYMSDPVKRTRSKSDKHSSAERHHCVAGHAKKSGPVRTRLGGNPEGYEGLQHEESETGMGFADTSILHRRDPTTAGLPHSRSCRIRVLFSQSPADLQRVECSALAFRVLDPSWLGQSFAWDHRRFSALIETICSFCWA